MDGELLSLRHDVLPAHRDRDYRSLRILPTVGFTTRDVRILLFDIGTTQKDGPRLRIDVFNDEGIYEDVGTPVDLLSIKGSMMWLFGPPTAQKLCAVFGRSGAVSFPTIFYRAVNGWRDRVGGDTEDERIRPTPRNPGEKRFKTPIDPCSPTPHLSLLMVSPRLLRMGVFGCDYSPLREVSIREQVDIADELAKEPAIPDSDIAGSGMESAPEPNRLVHNAWDILNRQWRGSIQPNENVTK